MLPISVLARRPPWFTSDLHQHDISLYPPGLLDCMTVCVAGICERSSIIVTVSDRLAAWGHGGSDQPLLKAARLAPLWITLMASEDLTRGIEDVIREARAKLREQGDTHSIQQVKSAVMTAWREARNERGEAAVLSPFRMTVDEFMRDGPKTFSQQKFADLQHRLENASTLCSQLLICGFNDKRLPGLFACEDDSPWHDFTRGGYVAIGSGAPLSLASLARQEYKRENDLCRAVYQLCVAKFAAESDPNVGRDTLVICLREDGKTCWITAGNVEWVRRLRERNPDSTPHASVLKKMMAPLVEESRWTDI